MNRREWRRELNRLQEDFDIFEDKWNYDANTYEDYRVARKPFEDAIEAHYRLESDTEN